MGIPAKHFWNPNPGEYSTEIWNKKKSKEYAAAKQKKKKKRKAKSQESQLHTFWALAGNNKSKILNLLRDYAERKFGLTGALAGLRNEYDELKKSDKGIRKKWKKPCIVCGAPPDCLHHIIQLKNGGINKPLNLAPICNGCHEIIHPHLKKSEVKNESLHSIDRR